MLVMFFGTSCVGKTQIMRHLSDNFEWHMISTFMTRNKRDGETEKFTITHVEMEKRISNGDFLSVNEYAGNYYATPLFEVEHAIKTKNEWWCLDFPLSQSAKLHPYQCCKIIILPENEKQLRNQICLAGRQERQSLIIAELHIYMEFDSKEYFKVINKVNNIPETCNAILQIVNKWRLTQ